MVMFVCNMCGASLKKNKVEEHYRFQCRNCDAVSCMDCGKDFWGDDYMMHNKCISEQEKYQGTPSDYKGDQKQEQWVANVTSVIETYSGNPQVKNLLRMCVDCPNLPRKQKKFVNFVKSSFNEKNQKIVCEAWDIIERASKMSINGNQSQGQQKLEEEEEKTEQDQSANITSNNHSPENETDGATSTNIDQQNDSLDSTTTTTSEQQLEDNEKDLSSSSPSPTREKRASQAEEDEVSDEQNGANAEEDRNQASGVESEKAKKKKAKKERKEQLAALQNCEGKKMSKKQLKRLREESISMDLASGSAEESNQMTAMNGLDQTSANRKDKKNKKKHREHKESVHEVICEENGTEESERGEETKKPDILAQIRLDDKTMKGIPKNANIEPDNSQDEEESEKQKERSFNWHKAIKTALKAEDDHSLSMKKLRKKVLAEFMTHGGDGKFKNETEIWALFDKKLHSYPKVKILKDRVTLVK